MNNYFLLLKINISMFLSYSLTMITITFYYNELVSIQFKDHYDLVPFSLVRISYFCVKYTTELHIEKCMAKKKQLFRVLQNKFTT